MDKRLEETEAILLKNDLRSYLIMKRCIEKDISVFDRQIAFCETKIKEIDGLLSAGNAKGIEIGYVPTTATSEPLLSLLAEQEKYIKRKDELLELKQQDPYGFKERVKFLDEHLALLDEWERRFVIGLYCENKKIDKLIDEIPKCRSSLYYDKDKLIYKMVKLWTKSNQ